MKLTTETIRQLIKEELSILLRESIGPMEGSYIETDGRSWKFLPRGVSRSGDLPKRNGKRLSEEEYQTQEKIAELASDGTIHVVEDHSKGKIEFYYLERDPISQRGYTMTYYGSLSLTTPVEEVYEAALQVKKEVDI